MEVVGIHAKSVGIASQSCWFVPVLDIGFNVEVSKFIYLTIVLVDKQNDKKDIINL